MSRLTLLLTTAGALALYALVAAPTAGKPRRATPSTAAHGSLSLTAHLASSYAANGAAPNYLALELRGADAAGSAERKPVNLVAVIDRSSSMQGEKLARAKEAALQLVEQLRETDRLGLVAYDDTAQTLEARLATPGGREAMRAFIAGLEAGGATNIGGGLLAAERAAQGFGPSRIVLLSDGEPTAGVTSPPELYRLVREMRERGATVSALGVGAGYAEVVLNGLAESGGGFSGGLADAGELAEVFTRELQQARQLVARHVELSFEVPEGVEVEEVLGHPFVREGRAVRVRLYDFSAGLSGRVLARVSVRLPARPGPVELGKVRLRYCDLLAQADVIEEVGFAAEVTDDPKLALLQAAPELLQQAARAEGAKLEQLAAARFREGQRVEGVSALHAGAERLRALFGRAADPIAEEMVTDARAPRDSNLMAKGLEKKKLQDFGALNGY